jgi:hypothetical protein
MPNRLDLLPLRLFENHFPFAFAKDYIHWYDHDQNEVVFRARKDPWSSKGAEWKLIRKGTAWRLVKDLNVLASIRGDTARMLSKIFRPLEDPHHIHTVWDTTKHVVHIHLPRLQLDFHIDHGDSRVQSRQYRGMIVDPDQTMGTLVGLTSKLVLSPSTPTEDRLVLVPVPRAFGSSSITRARVLGQHHVSISINKNDAHKVFAYSLDTSLGRVLESGDVQRRLFLAFLHALTSHCLPDALTGSTGTESALNILQSAAVRSFEYLTVENVKLLHEIASLSPLRSFYPTDLMVMQQVGWDGNLPFLSQHPQLRTCAEDIIKQAQTMQVFYPDQMPTISTWKPSNPHLEMRDAIRTSTFRTCDFGAARYTSSKDVLYTARDVCTQSDRAQRAYVAASLIVRNQTALDTRISDLKKELFQTHFKDASISGGSSSFDLSILQFDSEWLGDSTSAINNNWCDLHRSLPGSSKSCNKYNIMAWLSTMAFAKSADMRVLQAFASFYQSQSFATIKPPIASTFNLSKGSTWQQHEISMLVQSSAKSFDDSAEARIPKQGTETESQHINRIQTLFQERRDEAVRAFMTDLKLQWPIENPIAPTMPTIHTYIDVSSSMPSIKARYKTWHLNRRFEEYLQQTSDLMAKQNASVVARPQPVSSVLMRKNSTKGAEMMFSANNIFAAVPPVISREHACHPMGSALLPPCEPMLPVKEGHCSSPNDRRKACLEELCDTLETFANSKCEKEYVGDLRTSCMFLEGLQTSSPNLSDGWSHSDIQDLYQKYLDRCKTYFAKLNSALAQAVASSGSLSDEIGLLVEHSPRISPTFWLSQLHRDRFETLPQLWKTLIVEYGLAVTQLHRAQRLVALSTKPADLIEELGHTGHSNWDPMEFPETLLLEAESGILIRREQEFIASLMRDPQDAFNIVLQLLMGGGKSSTIVPVVAAYSGDKKK